ncbi:MAG: hypothetical protein K8U03_20145 [Planctomycetia bacterium]|nr:hypothetical protein [Planctomycetia bacterium]
MFRRLPTAVAILLVAFTVAKPAAAQSNFAFPGQAAATSTGFIADEQALLADVADGRLDRVPLLDAALLAGGTSDARALETYRRRFEHWVAELQVSGRIVGNERDRARGVLEYLHSRVLTGGFRDTSTKLDEAFEHGRFNCISSVILFRTLAARFGLTVHGVEVPGHAYAVVEAADESFIVQTTCRDWFAADGDTSLQRSLLRRTIGAAAADTAEQAKRERRLSDVGMLAVVYYNRGVDHLEAGSHEAAIEANRTALKLDAANEAARANLLAGLNNWSLELGRRGDFPQALRMLETGLQYAPEYGLFHENLVALYQQRLAGSTSTVEASPNLSALRGCYARWQSELRRQGATAEAETVARRASEDPFLRAVN